MEMLAVMLLIITVLAMGVPAIFAAERKSAVNRSMNDLIRVHQACTAMQLYLKTVGDPGVVTLNITILMRSEDNVMRPYDCKVNVKVVPATPALDPSKWLGVTLPNSAAGEFDAFFSDDQFVSNIISDGGPAGLTWTYQPKTGFASFTGVNQLTFQALRKGSTYRVNRTLNLYPQGYSEIP